MKHEFAATAIILKDKKVLMTKRSSNKPTWPNNWCFPGGKQDPGETPEQTIVREVKEEVGLDYKPEKIIRTDNSQFEIPIYRFIGTWSGEIDLDKKESSEYGWFNYKDLKKLDISENYDQLLEYLYTDGLID
jgi:mutator protein MutT